MQIVAARPPRERPPRGLDRRIDCFQLVGEDRGDRIVDAGFPVYRDGSPDAGERVAARGACKIEGSKAGRWHVVTCNMVGPPLVSGALLN